MRLRKGDSSDACHRLFRWPNIRPDVRHHSVTVLHSKPAGRCVFGHAGAFARFCSILLPCSVLQQCQLAADGHCPLPCGKDSIPWRQVDLSCMSASIMLVSCGMLHTCNVPKSESTPCALLLIGVLAAFVTLPPHMYRFLKFTVQSGKEYFPCTVLVEDEEALKPGRPYIVGKTSCHAYNAHTTATSVQTTRLMITIQQSMPGLL